MTSGERARPRRERFVVCGDALLALRIVEALHRQGSSRPTEVVVLVGETDGPYVPEIAAIPGARVLAGGDDDADYLAADVGDATAVAFVHAEDVRNVHRALRVQELAPDTRLVIRLFSDRLGRRIQALLPRAVVLSVSSTAAPSFVTAAIGRSTRQHIRPPGHAFVVAARGEVPPERVVCGLAENSAPDAPGTLRLLPEDEARADQVLAVADSPRGRTDRIGEPLRDRARVQVTRTWSRLRGGLTRRLARTALGLVGLLLAGTVAFALVGDLSPGEALFLTVLDAAGAADPDTHPGTAARLVQAVVTLLGIAIIPLVTAVVVDAAVRARVAGTSLSRRPRVDHVVVVGLGDVGRRVVEQLRERGVPVIGVDRDDQAPGVAALRRAGVPVVLGDATSERTLREAFLATSRALVAVTPRDATNLEAGLVGRGLRGRLRVVLRLRDDDLARRVERSLEGAVSRSVSFVSAPVFAAAMRDGQVLATVPIGRRVLLVADVPVGRAALFVGLPAATVAVPGRLRVVGVFRGGGPDALLEMPPRPRRLLRVGDRLLVVATRDGLGEVLVGCASRVDVPAPAPR